jgi:hypothetical protein
MNVFECHADLIMNGATAPDLNIESGYATQIPHHTRKIEVVSG